MNDSVHFVKVPCECGCHDGTPFLLAACGCTGDPPHITKSEQETFGLDLEVSVDADLPPGVSKTGRERPVPIDLGLDCP